MTSLAYFQNIHAGESVYVCGCGPSIAGFDPGQKVSIGVNDIGRYFDPWYLVCVNSKTCFTSERWDYIERSQAHYVFTDRAITTRSPQVHFRLREYNGVIWTHESLPYTENSPYIGLALAAYMGAKNIGLIGVDFVGHPNLSKQIEQINGEYARFGEALKERGVNVYNLSPVSALAAFPKMSMEEFNGKCIQSFG